MIVWTIWIFGAVFTHGWLQLVCCFAVGWLVAADLYKLRDVAYQRRVAAARHLTTEKSEPRRVLIDGVWFEDWNE